MKLFLIYLFFYIFCQNLITTFFFYTQYGLSSHWLLCQPPGLMWLLKSRIRNQFKTPICISLSFCDSFSDIILRNCSNPNIHVWVLHVFYWRNSHIMLCWFCLSLQKKNFTQCFISLFWLSFPINTQNFKRLFGYKILLCLFWGLSEEENQCLSLSELHTLLTLGGCYRLWLVKVIAERARLTHPSSL